MKILLDECIDQKLRFLFIGHDCQTAAYAKLAGLKNGVLLTAAESAGFDLMITTDQAIPYQQNLDRRRIAILILCAITDRLADLKRLVPAAVGALDRIKNRQTASVCGTCRTISRFLSPRKRGGDHSSRPKITFRLQQPTRKS